MSNPSYYYVILPLGETTSDYSIIFFYSICANRILLGHCEAPVGAWSIVCNPWRFGQIHRGVGLFLCSWIWDSREKNYKKEDEEEVQNIIRCWNYYFPAKWLWEDAYHGPLIAQGPFITIYEIWLWNNDNDLFFHMLVSYTDVETNKMYIWMVWFGWGLVWEKWFF